ncbi:MAG TPA: hypothetical protein VFK40_11640 [Nitrososphaeraceae archaeon]|nr:hypothetical protein [Nitrososphaeraceae archaeon]
MPIDSNVIYNSEDIIKKEARGLERIQILVKHKTQVWNIVTQMGILDRQILFFKEFSRQI